jgi:hypothetical protein
MTTWLRVANSNKQNRVHPESDRFVTQITSNKRGRREAICKMFAGLGFMANYVQSMKSIIQVLGPNLTVYPQTTPGFAVCFQFGLLSKERCTISRWHDQARKDNSSKNIKGTVRSGQITVDQPESGTNGWAFVRIFLAKCFECLILILNF